MSLDKKQDDKKISRRDALKRMAGVAVIAPAITAFTSSMTGCDLLFYEDYYDYYDYSAYSNAYSNAYSRSYSDYYALYSNYYNYHSE